MIRLFTTFYGERNAARRAELLGCLARNCASGGIDKVCVLNEGGEIGLDGGERLAVREIRSRPLYRDFFDWINELAGPDDISIIANTDIWFDGSVAAAERLLGPRECYALSRWDGDQLFDRNDSQDSWFFRGKVVGVVGDFPPGVPRCDNRILYELQEAGYRVLNPAFSLLSHHVHEGERAEYGEGGAHFVEPPYRYLWPHNLLGPLATWFYNLRHPGERLRWRFDRRWARRTLAGRIAGKLAGWRSAGVSAPPQR